MDLMQKRVDLGLIDPGNLNRYYMYYNIDPLNQFLSNVPKYDLPITKTETVYVESKSISQTKLRETGFKITRSKDNAVAFVERSVVTGSLVETPILQADWNGDKLVESVFETA